MLARAATRGINTVKGIAEALPFPDHSFDYALAVTTLCFVHSPAQMLAEARRVLRPNGALILGCIDRESRIGRQYANQHTDNTLFDQSVISDISLHRCAGGRPAPAAR